MAEAETRRTRLRAFRPLAFGGHVVSGTLGPLANATVKPLANATVKPLANATVVPLANAALKPLAKAATKQLASAGTAALEAGVQLERRAVDLVLESDELERILVTTVDHPRVQSSLNATLSSDGGKQLIAVLFESGAIDELLDRLLVSEALWRLVDGLIEGLSEREALWRLIDEIASSPAVTAAITQQSLGFAEEVRDDVRSRSRRADDWLARVVRRRGPRQAQAPGAGQQSLGNGAAEVLGEAAQKLGDAAEALGGAAAHVLGDDDAQVLGNGTAVASANGTPEVITVPTADAIVAAPDAQPAQADAAAAPEGTV